MMTQFRITVSKNYRVGWTAQIEKMPSSYKIFVPPFFFGFTGEQARRKADRWCKKYSEKQKKTKIFYTESEECNGSDKTRSRNTI